MKTIDATPVISNGAIYAAGDAMGGLLTFNLAPNAARARPGGTIVGLAVIDKDNLKIAMDVFLFDSAPATGTDNAAYNPSDADAARSIGHVAIVTGDYGDMSGSAVATRRDLNIPYANGLQLFAQLVTRGTPTHTATNNVVVRLTIKPDA